MDKTSAKPEAKTIWEAVKAEMQVNLSQLNYKTWIEVTQAKNLQDNLLEIICPSKFVKDKLQKDFHSLIQTSVNKIGKGDYELKFTIGDVAAKKPSTEMGPLFKPAEKTATREEIKRSSTAGLVPDFTFETYVMGANNRLAYAIATAVAENPGKVYNPFFLYSGVGLGKTHLIHAVGNKIIQEKPDLKVVYTTGESFLNELIEAIRNAKGRGNFSTNKFRNKYRNTDVLLIDDIQFIVGKDTTQEEFFHTFNALQMAQKQIVITSDRPPKDFTNLEDRITSRFGSGIIADIQSPDLDTRIAILRSKRDQSKDVVSNEVLDFIAEKIDSNIRELEGAYLQVLTFSKAVNEKLTVDTAAKALGQSIKKKDTKSVNLNHIMKAVAGYYSVTISEIKGKRRTKDLVIPRQVAMYLMYELTETPYMSIGELLGGRDHTTVMHGVRKIEEETENPGKTKRDITNIKQIIFTE